LHRTHRRLLWPALLFLSIALSACGGGGGGGSSDGSTPPSPGANGQIINFSVQAKQNGNTYAIDIFLPASYASGTALLPVIYATEDDAPYGPAGVSRFEGFRSEMASRGTQAILVGIRGTARRNIDFLLPGAAQYINFITKDLAPEIERQYRADPKKRALSGLSHGGYLVVAALILEGSVGAPSFSHYLSTDSSFGGDGNVSGYLAFEQQLKASGKSVPTTLFLAGSTNANGPTVVEPLYAQMASQAIDGLTLVKAEYNTTHVGSDLPGISRGAHAVLSLT
jgi:hypothetical protein